MRALATIPLALALASPLGAEAWRVAPPADSTGEEPGVATVGNEAGFAFEVAGGPGPSARCVFRLPSGDTTELHTEKPLELLIDDFDPQAVLAWREVEEEPFEDDGDFFEVARRSAHVAPLLAVRPGEVVFRCWMPLPRQSSPTRGTLRQLLEGERLVIHYFSSDGSYQETSFALEGAAGAIGAALDVPLEPSAADHLQDELLALRVHYRGQTCYLLAGKKSRKRCLEAVTECGRRSHDSVVSMLNCIEVE